MAKTFKDGFMYPFNNMKRLFNFWWVLVPVVGIFAVIGYFREIVEGLLKKKDKELPEFKGFLRLTKKGFMFFLIMLLPAILAMMLSGVLNSLFSSTSLGKIVYFVLMLFVDFYLAMLYINYVKEDKFEAVFDVKKVWEKISKDWNKTLHAFLMQALLMCVFLLMSVFVITLIITVPAMSFTGYYYLVELYNKA
ncbi:hypothetical protein C0585_00325 [Candidatus Woesearchaeota archaeon]|nr:MAG: hypothetical protein C0585_00325 [Candidatus Woesearchaeota archaeon]